MQRCLFILRSSKRVVLSVDTSRLQQPQWQRDTYPLSSTSSLTASFSSRVPCMLTPVSVGSQLYYYTPSWLRYYDINWLRYCDLNWLPHYVGVYVCAYLSVLVSWCISKCMSGQCLAMLKWTWAHTGILAMNGTFSVCSCFHGTMNCVLRACMRGITVTVSWY